MKRTKFKIERCWMVFLVEVLHPNGILSDLFFLILNLIFVFDFLVSREPKGGMFCSVFLNL